MSVQLHIEESPDFLSAKFIGSGVAEEVWTQFSFIAEQCKLKDKSKLLIDISKAEGTISVVEKYLAAEESRIFSRFGINVAIVEMPERIDPRRFFLLAARNRGVNVEVFTDLQSAEEWLLK